MKKRLYPRVFLPEDFVFSTWKTIAPYFDILLEADLKTKDDMVQWIVRRGEVEACFIEAYAWAQVESSCDTQSKEAKEKLRYMDAEAMPQFSVMSDKLNGKFIDCGLADTLDPEMYAEYTRCIRNQKELFRAENVPLAAQDAELEVEYSEVVSGIMMEYKGGQYTPQQMAVFLEHKDEAVRKEAYDIVKKARKAKSEIIHDIYDRMIAVRHQIAQNAGFENYRDYVFRAKNRFDYTPQDCFDFHTGIQNHMVPLYENILEEKRIQLKKEKLDVWDLAVDLDGDKPLKPFEPKQKEVLRVTKDILGSLRPKYGEYIEHMDTLGNFDVESRKGKRPGGFMSPMYETRVPFIFANCVGMQQDLNTMIHEGGHALHEMCMADQNVPSILLCEKYEMCEVASMAQELLTMEMWDIAYPNADDCLRAKRKSMVDLFHSFYWIATIDAFQHWIYENPTHSHQEREDTWKDIFVRFHPKNVAWTDYELSLLWQRQLHLFVYPFYYIEYAIAQLGALGVWRNYQQNPEKALDDYEYGLGLGGTKALPELFEATGIPFDFSERYIKEMSDFVSKQIELLTPQKKL